MRDVQKGATLLTGELGVSPSLFSPLPEKEGDQGDGCTTMKSSGVAENLCTKPVRTKFLPISEVPLNNL